MSRTADAATGHDWPVFPVHPSLRLRVTRDMPPLSPALDAAVERLWVPARDRLGLFNGLIFSADRVTPDLVEGHWTEYRREVAQVADPSLRPALGIRNLAVCGILCGPGGVAAGRRDARAAYEAGLWQLPPAGSVDTGAAEPGGASWQAALLSELAEELGIPPGAVRALHPVCLVEHPTGVLDLGIRIDTDLDAAAIHRHHAQAPHREYDDLFVAPPAEVPARVAAAGGRLTPSSAIFLRHAPPVAAA